MKTLLIALALLTGVTCTAAAEPGPSPSPLPSQNSSRASWLAKAKAEYPLKTCVVSGDELGGEMGEAVDYVYRQEGKPDRLVRFCCRRCVKKFEKDPAPSLQKIDEAAARTNKG